MINDQQYNQLLKPLNASRIAKRSGGGGKQLSYLEAWDVKAHLIRIFGFGGWSAEVIESALIFEEQNEKGQWNVGWKVTLRLTVHGATYSEAAVGSATLPQRGEAHDMAIKTAESDALKRAAINLGTQFGLSLYADGATRDVVGMTLDREAPIDLVPAEAPKITPSPTPVLDDSPDAAIWIEEMKAAVESHDVELLLEVKKRMAQEGVMDMIFQGITLAKWLDKGMASVGKGK